MVGRASRHGLCPWSSTGKVGAYAIDSHISLVARVNFTLASSYSELPWLKLSAWVTYTLI